MNIYKITNITNGLVYIGQTNNSPEHRFNQHIREAKCSVRKNYGLLHEAMNEFGKDSFTVELIESVDDRTKADEHERFWISFYNSDNPLYGYNCDSGGIAGGTKNDTTKKLIGETTNNKWNNPETTAKMLDGLRKGTETAKNNIVRVPFTCQYCGKVLYLPPSEARKKKYCSQQCVTNSGSWEKGTKNAAVSMHLRNLERKEIIRKDIIEWCNSNKDIVIHCPYNKVETTLKDMVDFVLDKYGIKDIRSIFICFGVKNKRSLLSELKTIVTSN